VNFGALVLLLAGQVAGPDAGPGSGSVAAPELRVFTPNRGRAPPVVIVPARGTDWAVVQLHVRLPEGTSPQQAESLAAALAEGGSDTSRTTAAAQVRDASGQTSVWVGPQSVAISDSLPASSLDDSLKAMERRLRSRSRLVPASAQPPRLAGPVAAPEIVRAKLAAPAPAPAQPPAGTAPDETPDPKTALRALASDALRAGEVFVVVLAPGEPAELSRRTWRHVRTQLQQARPPAVAPPDAPDVGVAHVALAATPQPPARGLYSWVWFRLPGQAGLAPVDVAAAAVLARLLGGRLELGDDASWLHVHLPLTDASSAEAREAELLTALDGLTLGAPEARVSALARLERGARWRALAAPERLALDVGRGRLLAQRSGVSHLLALEELEAAQVMALAARVAKLPRVAVRHLEPLPEAK
jgi:hypothetical protein